MKFWKMNGAGNDFIILNNLEEKLPESAFPALAKRLCTPHLSLGADGMMVVDTPTQGGDFRMRFYNSDGSLGEMCGNGARCICRFGYEQGLSGDVQCVETTAGIVTGERIDKRNYRIRLNDPYVVEPDKVVNVSDRTILCHYIELGNPGIPHAVVEIPDLINYPEKELRELGKALRYYAGFPKGANVNFWCKTGEDTLLERTYERGVEDFTLACGTGTGSVVYILTKKGVVSGKDVKVTVPGGLLRIDVQQDGLFLTGPTNTVACGEITDEEL